MSILPKKRQEPTPAVTRTTPRDLFEQLFDWGSRSFDPASYFAARMPEALRGNGAAMFPPMNVAEDQNGYDVTVELPGVEEKDIQVEVLGRQLVVTAERTWKQEDDQKQYHRVETRYGSMQRSMTLPDDAQVDLDRIDARYERGVLHVRVPKAEPTPKRRIEVKGGK